MKENSPNKNNILSEVSSNKDKNRQQSSDRSIISKRSSNRSRSPKNKQSPSILSNSYFKDKDITNTFTENQPNNNNLNQISTQNTQNTQSTNKGNDFVIKNGCCRDCMKAFSKSGKSCLCQVPKHERKFVLSDKGCNFCGCKGCNPLDIRKDKRKEQKKLLLNDNEILFKRQRIIDSDDDEILTNQKDSDDYNRYRADVEDLLSKYFKNFGYVGFCAPMRSSSYILGYNPKVTDIDGGEGERGGRKRSRNDWDKGGDKDKGGNKNFNKKERFDRDKDDRGDRMERKKGEKYD